MHSRGSSSLLGTGACTSSTGAGENTLRPSSLSTQHFCEAKCIDVVITQITQFICRVRESIHKIYSKRESSSRANQVNSKFCITNKFLFNVYFDLFLSLHSQQDQIDMKSRSFPFAAWAFMNCRKVVCLASGFDTKPIAFIWQGNCPRKCSIHFCHSNFFLWMWDWKLTRGLQWKKNNVK